MRMFTLLVVAFLVLSQNGAFASEDYMQEAQKLFNAWKFEEAAKNCEKAIARNPKNCNAHYLLGNIMFRWNRKTDAVREFVMAADLDPKGQIGQYSRQFLAVLRRGAAIPPANQKDPHLNNVAPGAESAEESGDPKQAENPKHAAGQINKEMTKQDSDLSKACTAEVERVQKEADETIRFFMNRMQTQIAQNGRAAYSRGALLYDPEVQNAPIRAECERSVAFFRAETQKKIDDIKALYAAKQSATEDSASSLHNAYRSTNQAKDFKLSPVGTTMHVRSYQTPDEITHDEVPMLAAPKKLPTKAPSR